MHGQPSFHAASLRARPRQSSEPAAPPPLGTRPPSRAHRRGASPRWHQASASSGSVLDVGPRIPYETYQVGNTRRDSLCRVTVPWCFPSVGMPTWTSRSPPPARAFPPGCVLKMRARPSGLSPKRTRPALHRPAVAWRPTQEWTFGDSAADGSTRHSQRIVDESLLSSGIDPPSSASHAYQWRRGGAAGSGGAGSGSSMPHFNNRSTASLTVFAEVSQPSRLRAASETVRPPASNSTR